DLGLAIPDDVAMVGYDDIGPVALLTPPLTTVRIAYYDFGRVAAQLLLDLIDGLAERPQRRVIEPELVVRGSSGPPPSDIRKLSRPAPELAGLTESRRVEVAGPPGELQEAVKNAIAANGDQPILPPDGGSKDAELEAGVCTLDLRRDLEKGLAATQPEADSIAGRLAQRRAGSLVLVAISPAAELSGGAAAAAAAAGVEHMTRALAARWSSRGIRVNALLARAGDMPSVLAAMLFLLSDEAAITGQTLRIGLPL
ncbi:MAG TPA: substrate-binding domain-containing protein, partial [Candidatus Dormibacteraeota bacterium]|nr:substrate-binding domain-containing protein [Candidatus Dormibacteraeota bacterium]